ncbi:MAG: Gfo/Idh/MocA family oxidoreductase [Oscillospiraceae bacterium]|nr:Gfo/Idh/MocA family oxidoreductase [Oscillospiraceae bacterium]
MMERKQLNVGMLGTGWMGKIHTHGFRTAQYMFHPKSKWNVEVKAACGTSEAKTKAFAERFGLKTVYTNYHEMLKDPEINVFDNVAGDLAHYQPTLDAIKAGKHVICEKPLSLKTSEAKEMWQAAEAAKVKHLCCFSYRFMPAVRLAYEIIKNGDLGQIYHFDCNYYQDPGTAESSVEDVWFVKNPGSGVDQGIGSHMIDMARFLIGDIASIGGGIAKTYVTERNSRKGVVKSEAVEGYHYTMEFKNGVTTGAMQCLGVAYGKQSEFSFEIFGSKGSLRYDVLDINTLHVYQPNTPTSKVRGWVKLGATEPDHPFMDIWWPRGHGLGWEHGHINMLAHFLDCVAEDKPIAPLAATFEDGYIVQAIIDAVHRSCKEGKRVDL